MSYVVPDVQFPAFPEPIDAKLNNDGTVTVSLDWFAKVSMYKADVDAAEKVLEAVRKEVENGK